MRLTSRKVAGLVLASGLLLGRVGGATHAAAEERPREEGTFRAPELVEIATLDPTIRLDVR